MKTLYATLATIIIQEVWPRLKGGSLSEDKIKPHLLGLAILERGGYFKRHNTRRFLNSISL